MKKVLLFTAVFGLVLACSSAHATDSVGCGLGSMAWKGEKGMVPQVLAATTNASFGTQTFGISTGTSGCDPNGTVTGGTGKMSLKVIAANMDQFAIDAAAGKGETIDTLAGILKMDNNELGTKLQSNFAYIFPSKDADAVDVTMAVLNVAKA